MSAGISTLSKDEVLALLANEWVPWSGNAADTLATLDQSSDLYKRLETTIDVRLAMNTAHSFHLDEIEVVSASKSLSKEFKRRLHRKSNIHFCFHGTTESNHTSIFNQGFLLDRDHYGMTDLGYIGKGVYFSPHPEYSAAYIRDTPGIREHKYRNPVTVGTSFKLLGCIVIVGDTRRVREKEFGKEIDKSLDSHWAWIESSGADITTNPSEYFAQEYAIREPQGVYPRFRLTLRRVKREVIWVDPNIANTENSGYVRQLKSCKNMFVLATDSSATALASLNKQKEGTDYRAITAGRGGKEFVRNLRNAGLLCPVLVFCNSVGYHSTWAKEYINVKVTSDTSKMIDFATWKKV